MICFSLCESHCHSSSGGCAVWPLTPTGVRELLFPHSTLQRAWSARQPEPDSPLLTRAGERVTVTSLSNYTKKHNTDFTGQLSYPWWGKNSQGKAPCSLTICCTQRWIRNLSEGAQTGHGPNFCHSLPPGCGCTFHPLCTWRASHKRG